MSNLIDLTGKRFGHWTVLERDYNTHRKNIYWMCKCDCGTIRSVPGTSLRSCRSVSCGCEKVKQTVLRSKQATEDLTSQRFGHWTVLCRDDTESITSKRGTRWICRCDCGKEKSVLGYSLRLGKTTSCGCQNGKHSKGRSRPISKDLSGQKFGKLTVLGIDKEYYGKGIYWKCQCDCGTVKSYRTYALVNGKVVSCGCESRRKTSIRKFDDLTGQRFGRLVVLGIDHKRIDGGGNNHFYWKCQCDCGNTIAVITSSLKNGDSKSCGCLQAEASASRAKDRTIDLVGHKYGLLTVIGRVDDPDREGFSLWRCLCDCGNEKLVEGYQLRIGLVASCGCLAQSKYELFVLKYFEEKGYESGIDYEAQKRFDDLRGYGGKLLSYDFSVIKNGKIYAFIECQGQQHYKPVDMFGGEEQFARQQLHDEEKRKYAEQLGVKLIEIPYTVVTYEEVKAILEEHDI